MFHTYSFKGLDIVYSLFYYSYTGFDANCLR